MIYQLPKPDEPIRQGDIFKSIPFISFNPESLIVADGELLTEPKSWLQELGKERIKVLVDVEPVFGIVATQDCDAARDKYVACFLVHELIKLPQIQPPNKSGEQLTLWWARQLTKNARTEQKWFYLPPDKEIGFSEKMVANFQTVIPVRSKFLLDHRSQIRIGRLQEEADEHFREHVAQYFRRYPYDEWYPLSKEEFLAYKNDSPSPEDVTPFPWQE